MNHEGTTTRRDSFVFYRSFYESIKGLPDEVQRVLFRAVAEYGLDQVVPDFKGIPNQPFVDAIFKGIRPQLDANYKRFLNGCNGGCPTGTKKPSMTGNQNARKKQNRNETKTKPNENVNDNGNDDITKPQPQHPKLSLPFADKEFADTWNELLKQPKWKNKSKLALNVALKQLSIYDVRFAIMLMQNAIAGNYQGIVFTDTPARYQQWQRSNPPGSGQGPQHEDVTTDTKHLYDY